MYPHPLERVHKLPIVTKTHCHAAYSQGVAIAANVVPNKAAAHSTKKLPRITVARLLITVLLLKGNSTCAMKPTHQRLCGSASMHSWSGCLKAGHQIAEHRSGPLPAVIAELKLLHVVLKVLLRNVNVSPADRQLQP